MKEAQLQLIVHAKDGKREKTYYETIKHVGHGTFGVVTKCRDLRTQKLVAVKKVSALTGGSVKEL